MMKLWIVTAADYDRNGNCDGKARVLGAFKSYGEAQDYVNKDMNEWAERNTGDECGCDFLIMSAWYDSDYSAGCEWNIEEVDFNQREIEMKLWIVTAVGYDYNGTCDGKARVLGAFKSYDEAKNYVDEDIREWVDRNREEGGECDLDKMAAWYDCDDSNRGEWNIEEVDVD